MIQTYDDNPNFTIVVPGGCNAACDFCFSKQDAVPKLTKMEYYRRLNEVLLSLPLQFRQVSISGGEPTISPFFVEALKVLVKYRDKFRKVVLTTNGTGMHNYRVDLEGIVDHVNISRHHYDVEENKKMFGGSYALRDDGLARIIEDMSIQGIDVSLNCVIDSSTSPDFIESYLSFCKRIGGIKEVHFRIKADTEGDIPAVDFFISRYKVIHASKCPVCAIIEQIIHGVRVYWKFSSSETDIFPGKVFELIFQPDGRLTTDWKGSNVVSIERNYYKTLDSVNMSVPSASRSKATGSCDGGSTAIHC